MAWAKGCRSKEWMFSLACASPTKCHWQQLESGWVKLNIDDSVLGESNRTGIGGIIRDINGKCLMGFAMKIGMANIFQVEALAILEGLKLVWQNGFKQVEVNGDNALLMDIIRNGFAAISNILKVRQMHEWCAEEWKLKFRYILRESNTVADSLAKAAVGRLKFMCLHLSETACIEWFNGGAAWSAVPCGVN